MTEPNVMQFLHVSSESWYYPLCLRKEGWGANAGADSPMQWPESGRITWRSQTLLRVSRFCTGGTAADCITDCSRERQGCRQRKVAEPLRKIDYVIFPHFLAIEFANNRIKSELMWLFLAQAYSPWSHESYGLRGCWSRASYFTRV